MRLIIDEFSIPGITVDYAKSMAEQMNVQTMNIRERDKDLYKITSQDFELEFKKLNNYSYLKDILDKMDSNDILITDDLDLADLALPRIVTIIGSDGFVYTKERIERQVFQEHINRMQGKVKIKPLGKSRDQNLNDQFKQTLFQYLNNVH